MAYYNIRKREDMINLSDVTTYCNELKARASDLENYAKKIGDTASDITPEVLSIGGKTPAESFEEVVQYLNSKASALIEFAEAAEERATEIYNEQDRYITDLENANTNTVALSDQSMAPYNSNDVTNTVGGNSTNTVGNTIY